jgi:hypothetical protein
VLVAMIKRAQCVQKSLLCNADVLTSRLYRLPLLVLLLMRAQSQAESEQDDIDKDAAAH